MPTERMCLANKPCPCGRGHVRFELSYDDSEWGIRDQHLTASIDCEACAGRYEIRRILGSIEIVDAEKYQQHERLMIQSKDIIKAALTGPHVDEMLSRLASHLEALPTRVAQHRVVRELRLDSRSLATFRSHLRDQPILSWVTMIWRSWPYAELLLRLYEFTGMHAEANQLRDAQQKARAFEAQAAEIELDPVMTLGPFSRFWALTGSLSD
jgi:hypothetical protein